jgi:hypothetical protein
VASLPDWEVLFSFLVILLLANVLVVTNTPSGSIFKIKFGMVEKSEEDCYQKLMYLAWMYLNCTYRFVHDDEGEETKTNSIERRMGGVHSCTGSILFTIQVSFKRGE